MRNLLKFGLCLVCLCSTVGQLRADDAFRKEIREVLQEAEKAAVEIEIFRERNFTLSLITGAYYSLGDRNAARKVMEKCLKFTDSIQDESDRRLLRFYVLRDHAKKDLIFVCQKVKKYSREKSRIPNAIDMAISSFVFFTSHPHHNAHEMGELSQLLDVAKLIKDDRMRSSSLSHIAGGLSFFQDNHEEALRVAATIKHRSERDEAYLFMIHGLVQNDKFELARKISKRIDIPAVRIRAFVNIMEFLDKKKQRNLVNRILKDAKALLKNSPEDSTRYRYSHLIALAGNIENALVVAKQIKDAGTFDSALSQIAIESAKQQTVDRALKILDLMKGQEGQYGYDKNNALQDIALLAAKRSGFAKALEVIDKISDSSTKDYALRRLAMSENENGNFKNATIILNKIEDLHSRSGAWDELSLARYRKGKNEEAKFAHEQALQTRKKLKHQPASEDYYWIQCAWALESLGKKKEAGEFLNLALKNLENDTASSSRHNMLNSLFRLRARLFGPEKAVKKARSYKTPMIRAKALLGVAEGMIDLQKKKKKAKK